MPSSRAITAAVRGWSPVIISGRMPAPLRARDGVLRLGARRIDHADQPGEDEVLLETASDPAASLDVRRPAASRAATPSVRSASPASASFTCRISARRSGVSGRRSSPDELEACTAPAARRARPW